MKDIAPWNRPVDITEPDANEKIIENGRQARILREGGFYKWTDEAKKFLTQALRSKKVLEYLKEE